MLFLLKILIKSYISVFSYMGINIAGKYLSLDAKTFSETNFWSTSDQILGKSKDSGKE